jgi:hypothetical protein
MGDKTVFIRSTPERRAGITAIKLMVDEAHRLRENSDLEAYSNIVGNIELALTKINPKKADEIPRAEESADFYRSYGKITEKTPLTQIDEMFAFLDDQLKSKSERLVYFEDILRLGFEEQMLGCNDPEFIEFI